MTQIRVCLLALFFSTSSPALKGNVEIWHSTLAAESGEILGPTGPGQFVLRSGQGALETVGVVRAYDGQNPTKPAYDSSPKSAFGHDAVSALATDEKKNGTTGDRGF